MDLQECIEDLDEALLVAFKGFFEDSRVEPGKRTLFHNLVEQMGRQPEVALSPFMQKFCLDIHDVRNRTRYESQVPDKKFVQQALGFVRNRLVELGVEICDKSASGYDPLVRRRQPGRNKTAIAPVTPNIKVAKKAWVRINELCRELEMKSKHVLAALAELDVRGRITQTSWIDRATADRLRARLGRDDKFAK